MPNVTKMHTMKNDDGSATEVYYGVKNAKYIEVIPGRTLDKELLDIHATIAKNLSDLTTSIESTNSSLNSNINSLNTALTSKIDEVNTTLGQRISNLNEDLEEVSTQVNINKNDIAFQNPLSNKIIAKTPNVALIPYSINTACFCENPCFNNL